MFVCSTESSQPADSCIDRNADFGQRILICGAGNLLLSDEGFGIHCIRQLEREYRFPDSVELLDAGTLGILVSHRIEDASRVYLLDCVQAPKALPGTILRYTKEDLLLKRLPLKLSPHQIGFQEMLALSNLRGKCPDDVTLLGAVPESLAPGVELTPALRESLFQLARGLIQELRGLGLDIAQR